MILVADSRLKIPRVQGILHALFLNYSAVNSESNSYTLVNRFVVGIQLIQRNFYD